MPFAAALVAAAHGEQPQVVLRGDATLLVRASIARQVQAEDWPPLIELLNRVVAAGIPVLVCEACSRLRQISDDELASLNARFVCPTAIRDLRAHAGRVVEL